MYITGLENVQNKTRLLLDLAKDGITSLKLRG